MVGYGYGYKDMDMDIRIWIWIFGVFVGSVVFFFVLFGVVAITIDVCCIFVDVFVQKEIKWEENTCDRIFAMWFHK